METNQTREPWNKGKLVAKSRHSSPRTSGPSESISKTNTRFATWLCSTWRSIASCVAVI